MTKTPAIKYNTTINGTSRLATSPIRLIPPKITPATTPAMITPTTTLPRAGVAEKRPSGTNISSRMVWVSWLAWNMGRQPTSPATLKIMARGLKRAPRAVSITYMGPPCTRPWSSRPRYSTANVQVKNLVDMPKIALTHIQNSAPGPPIWMAMATPLILPIPTVLARALDKA